jgi:MFS family permease
LSAPKKPELVTTSDNHASQGAWSALSHDTFRRFWLLSFVAFIGGSIQSVGAGWMMVTLGGSPLDVSLVQGIMSLSVMLVALPAGAIADLYDRRMLMLGALTVLMVATGLIGLLAISGLLTEALLLLLTFLSGIASATMTPAMQSTLPALVPRSDLPSAVTLNGMTVSASRSIGPGIAGGLIGIIGAGLTMIANIAAFAGLWIVVYLWQGNLASDAGQKLVPRVSVTSAVAEGLRFASTEIRFRTILTRTVTCFIGVSAIYALIPSIAAERFRDATDAGAWQLGWLLSCYGIGSVVGSLITSRLSRLTSRDRAVILATIGSGAAMAGLALFDGIVLMSGAMLIAGVCWSIAMTSINVSAQLILPRSVLARGLSMSMMALMAALAIGSAVWGAVATRFSLDAAMAVASGSTVAAAVLHGLYDRFRGVNHRDHSNPGDER